MEKRLKRERRPIISGLKLKIALVIGRILLSQKLYGNVSAQSCVFLLMIKDVLDWIVHVLQQVLILNIYVVF